jgi:hypothetical protein
MADNIQEARSGRASRDDHTTLSVKELYASLSARVKDLKVV